jgi:hypothetical protein
MVLGIGLFSAITATITSYMLATGPEGSPTRSIAELGELRAAGLLTDAEFEAKKIQLLEKI